MVTKTKREERSRPWFNVALIITSSIFALFLAEIGMRVYFYHSISPPASVSLVSMRDPHPTLGWHLRADQSVWIRNRDYSVQIETNSRGFRDVVHKLIKKPDTFRIVVLGDSFMEAYQVAMENSFPRLLERYLADYRVEVINLGTGGYGTTQEYLMLIEEGVLYAPDLVLLGFFLGNDIRNNSPIAEKILWNSETIKTFGRPFASINSSDELTISKPDYERSVMWMNEQRTARKEKSLKSFLKRIILFETITRAVDKLKHRNKQMRSYDPNIWIGTFLKEYKPEYGKTGLSKEKYQQIWQNAWTITVKLIKKIEETTTSEGARFALFTVPALIQVEDAFLDMVQTRYPELIFDVGRINRQLNAFCDSNSLSCKDLLPAFRIVQESGRSLYYEIADRHWNERGHDLAAREISLWLARNFIPPQYSRSAK